MLGNKQGKLLNEYIPDYVIFDIETTGLSNLSDEIIELSAIKVRKGKIVDEFSELVNPGRKIPYAASMVNNITDRMVATAPTIDIVLEKFIRFIGDDVLVGHNIARFDMKFIYSDCEKYYGKIITNNYIDTLNIAKMCFPTWKNRRLSDLADHYGISTQGAHRALTDCKINQKVFELLGEEMKKQNIESTMVDMKKCPLCNQVLERRNGRYGEFWGCVGYPGCRYTENIR